MERKEERKRGKEGKSILNLSYNFHITLPSKNREYHDLIFDIKICKLIFLEGNLTKSMEINV